MFIFVKMRIANFACMLSVAWFVLPSDCSAAAIEPSDDFQQTFNVSLLMFQANSFWRSGSKVAGDAPVLIDNNARSYATVEVVGEELSNATSVEFLSVNGRDVLDSIELPRDTATEVYRTIPLTNSTIRIRVSANTVGKGRIIVKKILRPFSETEVPAQLTAALQDIVDFAKNDSPEKKQLASLGESIAFLQIAEPDKTVGCTGFVIAPNMVATAAHCLRGAKSAEAGNDWKTAVCRRIGLLFGFRSSKRDSTPMASMHCDSVLYLDEKPTSGGEGLPTGYDITDVAVMRVSALKRPALAIAPIDALTTSSPVLVSVIQHPQGLSLKVASDCAAAPDKQKPLFKHKCPTAYGSSGAPVVLFKGSVWRVIGMHTCCGGSEITGETPESLRQAIALWNAGLTIDAVVHATTN
jgi:Trypsin-like peptidase domain